ncbi:unnamed protein product [Rotaria magnacalcarata]|uniref:F-box domain-containing protein n=1 Tax=Rotaria magnacalcarata TaxID=392030 RepID=A0A815QBM9_9BILA|nr:unnamed protein product [Rotaria magnacalcarata]CAF1461063.1 unnamed protein product [Rotaria magnacalcarata]CAF2130894.1 unnamed protein product [Rotaria magnacalcarata]CAF2168856.1 unnamed protein product [Rotaria magnacalcarata]CAF4046390.1 unnamed protein product [Rotaria magnacalcarata]
MACILDSFPMEVLHMIFDYLNPMDLLQAFDSMSSYIDTILHSYSHIRLNCKAMNKSTFYFICERIHPEQLQYLVLSDDEHTPGQIKLFMSLVPLIHCMNLELINMIHIDNINLLCLILSHLEDHPRIQSLIVSDCCMKISKNNSRYITNIFTSLPSLKYLTFMDSATLTTLQQPLLKLTHLKICSCDWTDLKIIFQWVPNLVSLNIIVPFSQTSYTFDYIPLNLSSLVIESQRWTLFSEVENLLSLTKSLKRFIFETNGELALLDAKRWETLIKTNLPQLTEFALNITPQENNLTGDDVLTPFQNTFWTNEKHCQMACLISSAAQSCAKLFSVPHFAPSDAWYPPNEYFINYSITPCAFDDNYKELRVYDLPSPVLILSPYKHIRTLSVECSIDNIDQLIQIISLSSIRHLTLASAIQSISLYDILLAVPNVRQITIGYRAMMRFIGWLSKNQNKCEQIRELYLQDTVTGNDIDLLSKKLPKLEYISLHVKELDDIFHILNEFYELKSATIHCKYIFKKTMTTIDEYLRENNICTDGTYCLKPFSLCVWIDEEKKR